MSGTLAAEQQLPAQDWTGARLVLTYQCCQACRGVWYFRRLLCPSCGASTTESLASCGEGIVAATTTIQRSPTSYLARYLPYQAVLVDMQEGFRIMAHGASCIRSEVAELVIGDAVSVEFHEFAARQVPLAIRVGSR